MPVDCSDMEVAGFLEQRAAGQQSLAHSSALFMASSTARGNLSTRLWTLSRRIRHLTDDIGFDR